MADLNDYSEEDDDEAWDAWDGNVEASCAKLRENDPTVKKVHVNSEHGRLISTSLRGNTVVENLVVEFIDMEDSVWGTLNDFILASPSLKEFEFYPIYLGVHRHELNMPSTNLMMFSTSCGQSPVETLTGVPLCQSTALSLSTALQVNKNLRNLSIRIPIEEAQHVMETVDLIRSSLAPQVAAALSSSSVESLCLKWSERQEFPTREAFLSAFPGHLPASLQQLEINTLIDSASSVDTLVGMIEHSGPQLQSFLFSFCKIEHEGLEQILSALKQHKPRSKVLHYGQLRPGTSPVLAQSINDFVELEELGVGFDGGWFDAFESFCGNAPFNETVKSLEVQMVCTEKGRERTLLALAGVLTKFPNLRSITFASKYFEPPMIKKAPEEFLVALEKHKHLVDLFPKFRFADPRIKYYLTRNRFRDRLESTKPVMIDALAVLNDEDAVNCTLVKNTLCARDDWLKPGVDHGKPLPPAEDEGTKLHRFHPYYLL